MVMMDAQSFWSSMLSWIWSIFFISNNNNINNINNNILQNNNGNSHWHVQQQQQEQQQDSSFFLSSSSQQHEHEQDEQRFLMGGDSMDDVVFGVHISYGDLYHTLVFLTLIFLGGKAATSICKMPSLVGEIMIGIVLGPPLANFVRVHTYSFCFVRSEFFGTLNTHTHTQNVLSYSLFCFLSLFFFFCLCFGNGVFSFFFRNRLWLVHHHTYTHTTMLLVFSQSVLVLVGGPYTHTYTHTTMLLVFSQQVPNPEAFVLLGEIGYVFHFDNIFLFSKERESFFCFVFGATVGGWLTGLFVCCCFCLYHLGG